MSLHSFLVGVAAVAILTFACRLLALYRPQLLRRARGLFGRHSTMHARPRAIRRDNWDDDIEQDVVPDEPLLPLPPIWHADPSVMRYANAARRTANQLAGYWPNERSAVTGRIVSDTAYDRAMSADLRHMLDQIDAARHHADRAFAGIVYQARHALALPAGAS